jgi:hypothetical protein
MGTFLEAARRRNRILTLAAEHQRAPVVDKKRSTLEEF